MAVGERGLKASALSSMNLCMKEKNQAVKGDAPGKFKLPLDSGEECARDCLFLTPCPNAQLRLESSAPPSARLGAGADLGPTAHGPCSATLALRVFLWGRGGPEPSA